MLDEGSPEALVVQYLRVIVIPLLTAEFRQAQNCDVVVADGLIAKITAKAWKASPSSMSSALLSEYLQLTSILIVNALPRLASDTRPVVAKYVWDFLKHPEPIVRNSACLTAARLFSLKEVTSEKFQRPLWLTLLKAPPDGELSPVARQALDIMTPVMPRLASPDVSLRWDQAICRTLVEEQHNLVTTVHIYRLLLRHSDQCYQSKESFVPPIAQGLTRLGFNPGFTGETRTLALDLVDLIINWHRRASEEAGEAMVVDSTSPAASWEIPTHLKENIIGYLIRFAAAATPDTFRAGLNTRALTQLKTLCSLPDWSDLNVRMSYFSRILETPENSDSGAIWNLINCVKALNVVITDRSDAWVLQRAGDLFAFTKRVLVVPQDPVIDSFSSVLDRVFDVLPVGEEGTELTGPAGDLWQWISEFVRESLGNLVRIPGTLAALLSVVKHSPSRIEPFGHGLMKLFHRLIKEHAASLPADQANANVQRIFSVLEISKLSVRCLGDHRKQFLSGLVQLVNTTPNGELRRRLLAMAREWVMTPGITVPTTKEKASLMQKMQSWSKYNDQVYQDYLKLVYEIYSTPSMARTDLTVRLEASFILGCKAEDPALRRDFLDLFDAHIPKQIGPRLAYLLGGQGWDVMIEFNWAYVVLDMILAAVNEEAAMSPAEPALSTLADHVLRVKDILHPLRHIFFYDSLAMSRVFVSLFGEIWHGLPRKEQGDITASIIIALTRQAPQELPRNNVFQTLLAAVQRCNPPIALPPHVVKYLSKTYHSWYEGLEFLQSAVEQGREDDASVREANQDALAELYAELSEDDYYYGLWRRRCLYEETNAALSFEQNGLYQFAQPLYETAQIKARQNIYPMSEAEYYVWEDHWMLCSQKLLQWDILQDVASGEANADLALECAWRTLQTWNHDNVAVQTFINSYQGVLTPRRQLFKAYYTLYSMACTLKEQQALMAQAAAQNQSPASRVGVMATGPESDFARFVDEANQLSLRKWIALPEGLTQAHVKILGQFQQVVELREASLLMSNLTSTTRENLNEKAAEAKGIFHHWRERLPLQHDEIDIWNDVVSWRQHVFHAVNKFYLPLSPDGPGQAASGTHIHRGHHESAWIINRFAHVARRHGLLQVCQNSLADIYKLPNIEISEAFLKLREQARCHLERPNELYQGLEVINNTNLVYFTGPQKSEFFAMKGVFLHKLARHDDANAAFGQAVQLDISMPKAWAKWGVFQDDMHHLTPTDFSLAASAVSCYLQAASLHKNAKCRPLLNRVLWLLSMDDQEGTVAQSWDKYQGEHVYWYWITFIPQLLMSLSQREGRCAHFILHGIAKTFPQALYYPLRAQKDEFQTLKKEHMQRQAVAMTSDPTSDTVMNGVDGNPVASGATIQDGTKHSWDMAEELVALLKTGHPLLALSLEQIAEQIRERLKPNLEEEAYRMTTSLLSDALTHLAPPSREMHAIAPSILLTAQKVASTLPLGEMRTTFEVRLSKPNATMVDIVQAIVSVRDQIESTLDRRPRFQSMEVWSHFLVEFHLNRSEKVSVPGQYLEHKDNNSQFIEIKRISTRLERCRSPIIAFRRLTFMGHDGSAHMFMIQPQSARSSRREERLAQITRIFNERLSQKKEAKKRNLEFNVVPTVFLNAFLRLVKLDSSYVGFMDIYDEHCAHNGFGREEPSLLFQEKLRTYYYAKMDEGARGSDILKIEYWQARLDAKNEVESKLIPKTILSDYMKRTFKDSTSLWLMRKQFTRQISALNFLSYCMHVQVQPRRMLISRQTGAVSIIDCSLVLRPDRPSLQWNDSTPFRLTPNIQTFVSPLGIEGLMTSSMLALSRGLLEPELDIEKQLWLFLRDDFTTWYKQQGKNLQADEKLVFRVNVAEAITAFIKRMYQLSAGPERTRAQAAEGSSQLPTQTVVGAIQTLINLASNPLSQAKNPDQYYPWY
ncbi:Transcription-associated protein 1 [Serendipita indica DSM 11827]|nr:Transcription-associated protein 1 [Serendipita indica DSM 11827]